MSVSQDKPASQTVAWASFAAPVPSIALFAAGTPAWLCIIAIVISAVVAYRPVQLLILQRALTFTGVSTDEARKWAFRAVYYRASPDPTLQDTPTAADAAPPALLSIEASQTQGAAGVSRAGGALSVSGVKSECLSRSISQSFTRAP